MSFYPKCIHNESQESLSNLGMILPCCWIDDMFYEDKVIKDLFKEKFKLSNISNREDYLLSEEWLELFDVLLNRPDEIPEVCMRECGSKGKRTRHSYYEEEVIRIIE